MLFSASTLALTALFWLSMLLTRSVWIDAYYIKDHTDTAMDWFNMLAVSARNIKEFYATKANYPALPFVFWRLMLGFMQRPVLPEYEDGFYLRAQMMAQLGYILFTMSCLLAIWECIQFLVQGTKLQKCIFAAALLFCGPMIFLLERGNILLLCLLFLLLFMALYDSEDKRLRYTSYICLSLAAAVKIYPAVFGVMVIKKKRYREAGILLGIGIAVFFLPFLPLGGLSAISQWVHGVFSASEIASMQGYGYNYSVANLARLTFGRTGLNGILSPLLICAAGAVALIIFIASKEEWKQWFALVLICVWIPSFSYTYTLVLLFLPIISCFGRDRPKTRFDDEYLTLFVITMIPMTLPILLRTASHNLPTSWGHLLGNAALLGIAALILIEGVLNGSIKMRKIRSLRQNGEAETAAVTRGQPAESNQDENRGDD